MDRQLLYRFQEKAAQSLWLWFQSTSMLSCLPVCWREKSKLGSGWRSNRRSRSHQFDITREPWKIHICFWPTQTRLIFKKYGRFPSGDGPGSYSGKIVLLPNWSSKRSRQFITDTKCHFDWYWPLIQESRRHWARFGLEREPNPSIVQ